MLSQGFLSHKPCMAKLSGERECVCVCVCVCAFLDRVSLYDTKPSFLSLKFSVICLYKGLGYSFQATWTKIEAPVYGPKSTILPFLSVTYINPPIFSSRGPGSHSKGTFNLNYFAVLFDFTGYLTFTFIHHMIRFGHY